METSGHRPTPDEAAEALLEADRARDLLSHQWVIPSGFHSSIGIGIFFQIVTVALGVSDQSSRGIGLAVVGLVPIVLIGAVQLFRFRQLNGAWVSGMASRVVLGGDPSASTVHLLAMGAAMWAAFAERWWLVGLCAVAGGIGYALCGVRWVASYRNDPATYGKRESALVLAGLSVLFVAAAVLLVAERR